jgi:hypothetical protein
MLKKSTNAFYYCGVYEQKCEVSVIYTARYRAIYSLWMMIELAAPPPLQIAAAPNCPDLSRWVKVTMMREPEELRITEGLDGEAKR